MKIRTTREGVHLFERQSGLNILFDEVATRPAQWAKAPRNVSIALTNTCDLDCSFCFAPKSPGKLKLDQIIKWATELDDNGCLGIGFGGGEPTLLREFADMCHRVKTDTQLGVSFTTHGHHMTPSLSDALRGRVHFIRVSMDGVGATYEAVRGRSFAEFVERISCVNDTAPWGINYVVNRDTIDDLDEAVEFATSAGAVEFLLLPQRSSAAGPGIDPHTAGRLESWIMEARVAIRLAISEADAPPLVPIMKISSDDDPLESFAHVDANGVLKRTSFNDVGISIGNRSIMEALSDLRTQSEVRR